MKVDLKRELKNLYNAPSREPVLVDVPEMSFLMIDGTGDPNTSAEYSGAVEALYTLSYGIKFAVKKGKKAIDFAVMPLEGLWWTEDMTQFDQGRKDVWQWTAMIMQPEYVTNAIFEEVLSQVSAKKKLPALPKVRFGRFHEGLSAQMMHIGPYSAEAPTIETLHSFIIRKRHTRTGKHHEIYLSNPERTAPEKVKTIIRQPVI